ncbi:MAG: tRNA (adenosine(37)-N6)-dimethylallyltransferase MiaA, partial [Gemmatimonadota bacterium]
RGRIERRADALLDGGWLDEVRALRAAGLTDAPPFEAVGYRDVLALADGALSREEARERVIRDTWSYARRQRTWFRHQLPAGAVRLDALRGAAQLARRIAEEWGAAVGLRGDGRSAGKERA